jgi:hypothetical protein
MTTRPAPKPIRRVISKPLRNSARGKHCTLRLMNCEPNSETVVLAHLRGHWALGIAAKPHDFFAVYACGSCHGCEERSIVHCTDQDRLRALYETQSLMLEAGLISVKGD